eukprot:3880636-Pyramimonas_sp.AAC.2
MLNVFDSGPASAAGHQAGPRAGRIFGESATRRLRNNPPPPHVNPPPPHVNPPPPRVNPPP